MFHTPLGRLTTGPAVLEQPFTSRPPLSQLTVPAFVKEPPKCARPLPFTFNTPAGTIIKGPPIVPPAQFNVPVTMFVPAKVLPESVRFVIVPPWKLEPRITVPPVNARFCIISFGRVRLPPVSCADPAPVIEAAAPVKLPP